MPESYLLDTDVLIDVSREVPEAVRALNEVADRALPAISVVTKMELIVGCRDNRELSALDRFLDQFDVIHLRPRISEQALELLRRFRLSHGLLIADCLIAATAVVENLSLISKNQRDFRFIEELDLLPYPEPFLE